MICALWLFAGLLGVMVALMFGVNQRIDPSRKINVTAVVDYDISPWDRFAENETFMIMVENSTGNGGRHDSLFEVTDNSVLGSSAGIINIGLCQENDILLNDEFQFYYQKLYNTIFPLCLTVVVVLYILIYRSVLVRRNRRQQQKSKSLVLVQSLVTSGSKIEV